MIIQKIILGVSFLPIIILLVTCSKDNFSIVEDEEFKGQTHQISQ